MDRGRINRAIEILSGGTRDYLWTALIAKNADLEVVGEAKQHSITQCLGSYIDRGEYGRAVAASQALNLPMDEIAALFYKGMETKASTSMPSMPRPLLTSWGPSFR
jgi:hypothetical protein